MKDSICLLCLVHIEGFGDRIQEHRHRREIIRDTTVVPRSFAYSPEEFIPGGSHLDGLPWKT